MVINNTSVTGVHWTRTFMYNICWVNRYARIPANAGVRIWGNSVVARDSTQRPSSQLGFNNSLYINVYRACMHILMHLVCILVTSSSLRQSMRCRTTADFRRYTSYPVEYQRAPQVNCFFSDSLKSKIRSKKYMLVSCHMPNKVRVGRSAVFWFCFFIFVFAPKGILWAKLEENLVCKKKWLKIVKTVFFG